MAMRRLAAGVVVLWAVGAVASSLPQTPSAMVQPGLYDANPNHLWNQIHEVLHVRIAPDGTEYGFDRVDPLLWRETRHLLTGASHVRAVRALDNFLAANGERLVRDPLKRGVFQHDLWAIFDWLSSSSSEADKVARIAMMRRVSRVIRRVALSRIEIEALPDTYAAAVASRQPFMPDELFSATGPWVSIGGSVPVVPEHADELSRSAFIVLWNLPGGSAETIGYLQKLWSFPQPFVRDESFQFGRDGEVRTRLNPALPPLPDGTRIALVRKMLLIDDAGVIVPSNIVQSIQLRAFPGRAFSEVQMSRAALFTGTSGGLRAVRGDETDFLTFSAMGIDPLEQHLSREPIRLPRVLDRCVICHQVGFEPSIMTVRSVRQMLKSGSLVDTRHERWGRYLTQPIAAAEAKRRSYEWGVLQGCWLSEPR